MTESNNSTGGNDPTGKQTILTQTDLIKAQNVIITAQNAVLNAQNVLIKAETDKIDSLASDGLLGVANSVGYVVAENDRHNHNWERWMGAAAVAVGETHVADNILTNPDPFQATSGNDDWGAWLQIGGSDDTPIRPNQVKFDMHRVSVTGFNQNNGVYFMQMGFDASGAAALSNDNYTEYMILTGTGLAVVIPISVITRRVLAGTKCWSRILCRGQNAKTLDFYAGIHEYEG